MGQCPPSCVRRLVLKQPIWVLVAICIAFGGGSLLTLWLSTPAGHVEPVWSPSFDTALNRRILSDVDGGKVGSSQSSGSSSLRATVKQNGASQEESATLRALSAIEGRLVALDDRVAAAERSSAAKSKEQPQGQMSTQVAALSQTVAAVLSLVASEHQRSSSSAEAPAPAPPRTFSWEDRSKLDDIKRDVEEKAGEAAKEQIGPEINKLKKIIKRLAGQSRNQYTQLLRDLGKLSPDSSTAREKWPEEGTPGSEASTLSPEQATGHSCRSPPCSRDVESCKFNDNCCSDRMYEMLSDFSEFLTSRNITHFVVAGTLLGAIRDKDIIPYTSDIDMLIPREGWKKAMEINYIKGRKRSYYFQQDPHEHHCGRLCAVWEGLPVNRDNFIKHFDWDTDQLGADIQYYMDIYDEDMDFAKKLKHLHYPLSNVTIRNRTFPAPGEQQLWVEAKYGPSWRTPDGKSHGENIYPTLTQAQQWSQSMLALRKARTNAVRGHRLLERATVDYKTGNIVMASAGDEGQTPNVAAKKAALEGFVCPRNSHLTNGTVVIVPPDSGEGQITQYNLAWGQEQPDSFDKPKALGEPFASVPRCAGGGDPFTACKLHGTVLKFPLPHVKVPKEATSLLVISANEVGSGEMAVVDIPGRQTGKDALFTRRAALAILGALESDLEMYDTFTKCLPDQQSQEDDSDESEDSGDAEASKPSLLVRKDLEDHAVSLMLKHTTPDMKDALRALAAWLEPVVSMLQRCIPHESTVQPTLDTLLTALGHLLKPSKFKYVPGKVLEIDGVSIFLGINHAIGQLRKDDPSGFGQALGEFLKSLAVAPTTATPAASGKVTSASK